MTEQIANNVSRTSLSTGTTLDEVTPNAPLFPKPPNSHAFYGLAGEIVETVDPQTEADPVAILTQALVMFGNAIGRKPHIQIESSRHGCNLFMVLVGDSSSGRKGTSFGVVRSLFAPANPDWEKRIGTGISSGEGLIQAVRDPRHVGDEYDEGVDDKRFLAEGGEFGSILKNAQRQGNTVTTVLRIAWDGTRIGTLTKNPLVCDEPHISVIGHVTPDELRSLLRGVDMANGFANRFMFIAVKKSKFLPFGGRLSPDDRKRLVDKIREAIDYASDIGEVGLTKGAVDLWIHEYRRLTSPPPGMIGMMSGRAAPIIRRLAMVYALMNCRSKVNESDLRAAIAVWDYCQASLTWIFPDSTGDDFADEIRDHLQNRGSLGLTRTELSHYFHRNISAAKLSKALTLLEKQNRACRQVEKTGGRPVERWFSRTALPNVEGTITAGEHSQLNVNASASCIPMSKEGAKRDHGATPNLPDADKLISFTSSNSLSADTDSDSETPFLFPQKDRPRLPD